VDLAEARTRIPDRELPAFWIASNERASAVMQGLVRGHVSTLTTSPGGRPIQLVSYGAAEAAASNANFNSACGGRDPRAYMDKRRRGKPVVMLVGPVHGHETEGLTGLMNLLHVLETGRDLAGTARPRIVELAEACRLLIIPVGNPDGLARFEPESLAGMELDDIRFWGQGALVDGTLWNWPGCKARHPMAGDDIGFLGCYFNDGGVNPMHDEFFAPMGPEAPAILDAAMRAGPDIAVLLHSCECPSMFLRTAFVPHATAQSVYELAEMTYDMLERRGLPHEDLSHLDPNTPGEAGVLNLTSAIYHTSGAMAVTFESPHGTRDGCAVSFRDMLEIQLTLYEAIMEYALAHKLLDSTFAERHG
jgi:hypothetical protein